MSKKKDFFDVSPEDYGKLTDNKLSKETERLCASIPKNFSRSFRSWVILRGLKLGEVVEKALTNFKREWDTNSDQVDLGADSILKRNQEVAIDLLNAGYKMEMIANISKLSLEEVKSLETNLKKRKNEQN